MKRARPSVPLRPESAVEGTLQPALPDELDQRAERLMRRLCDKGWTKAELGDSE